MTADPWDDVSAARLPAAGLAALAAVRDRPEVRVHLSGDAAWVTWPVGRADVVRCLRPARGVVFLTRRGGSWFPRGSRLPVADGPPDGAGLPVAAVLAPARFDPTPPGRQVGPPVPLRIVRGGTPQWVTALACRSADLGAWADRATSAEIAAVRGARSGPRVVLLGAALPVVPAATRYWGTDVLLPVGFRADPDLPPAAIAEAVGAAVGDVVLLDAAGADVIPRAAFEPLTRAGVRLAIRDSVPGFELP